MEDNKRIGENESEALQYHIACRHGDVGKYVILPGDPGRSEVIASYFDDPVKIAANREFVTYTGTLLGEKVSVTSTGIGGPSAAIAMEELSAIGADTFVRVGTCGGISMKVSGGDCVIATAATRCDGTSREYAPVEYPAVADYEIVSRLVEAAKRTGVTYHTGVVQSKDSFYGQHSPMRMPTSSELLYKWEAWKRLGVLASEMECATLFTVAASLGVRCGGILHVVWNQEKEACLGAEHKHTSTENAIITAVEAVKMMILQGKKESLL